MNNVLVNRISSNIINIKASIMVTERRLHEKVYGVAKEVTTKQLSDKQLKKQKEQDDFLKEMENLREEGLREVVFNVNKETKEAEKVIVEILEEEIVEVEEVEVKEVEVKEVEVKEVEEEKVEVEEIINDPANKTIDFINVTLANSILKERFNLTEKMQTELFSSKELKFICKNMENIISLKDNTTLIVRGKNLTTNKVSYKIYILTKENIATEFCSIKSYKNYIKSRTNNN